MPIKANYSNPLSRRFDFGVPLEDIFPPNNIHPKLKYLFEEAYTLYASSRHNIEHVVRQLQGSLETRLNLKQKLLKDVHYDIKTEDIEEAPGAYFWLIRHFLGLLPIPLLPSYSQEIRFDWISLSDKCKNFLQHYESQRDKKYRLDYEFAENLNLLPFEHFLLLTILINFIRMLSKKNGERINRKTLLFICKYYSGSICVRPYTPGHKDQKMFPLFCYIVLRWREIEKYCRQIGHPAYFLKDSCLMYETYTNISIKDNWAQTQHFVPKVISIYKNMPYFSDNNNYLKDISCQTEQTISSDKGTQQSELAYEESKSCSKLKNRKLSDEERSSVCRSLLDTTSIQIDSNQHLNEDATSTPLDKKCPNQAEKFCDNAEFPLLSTDSASNKAGWKDIMKETADTVKKVEDYIYDDYDTFSKEEYNQISNGNKNRGSLIHKVSRIGWTYTPENSVREDNKEPSLNRDEMEDTYVKFEDVFDENGKYKTNDDCDSKNESEVKDNALNITFKKCNIKTPLCNNNSERSVNGIHENEEKSKKNFNLKRFKLKLGFLRMLTPKRATYSTPSYDSIESKIKYKKIKNIKSNTL